MNWRRDCTFWTRRSSTAGSSSRKCCPGRDGRGQDGAYEANVAHGAHVAAPGRAAYVLHVLPPIECHSGPPNPGDAVRTRRTVGPAGGAVAVQAAVEPSPAPGVAAKVVARRD